MALRTAYRRTSAGIRIPYPAQDGVNKGFVDLRGRPDLAAAIAEAVVSNALRNLLVRLATPGSPIVSLGCDLATHAENAAPAQRRHVAGGVALAWRRARLRHGPSGDPGTQRRHRRELVGEGERRTIRRDAAG